MLLLLLLLRLLLLLSLLLLLACFQQTVGRRWRTHATRRDIAVAISLAFNKVLHQHMRSITLGPAPSRCAPVGTAWFECNGLGRRSLVNLCGGTSKWEQQWTQLVALARSLRHGTLRCIGVRVNRAAIIARARIRSVNDTDTSPLRILTPSSVAQAIEANGNIVRSFVWGNDAGCD